MNQKSFTLIEILIVIVIIGILSALILVAINSIVDSTQDAKRKKDLDSISKSLMEYGTITGSYPVEAFECNIGDGTCLNELIDTGYAKNFPLDPSGARYKYTSDGTTYTISTTISNGSRLAYSPDNGFKENSYEWTARDAAEATSWGSVAYGNGVFVASSYIAPTVTMTSPDGITWTARDVPVGSGFGWRSITYSNGLFVAVSDNNTYRVMTSPDGITWTARDAAEVNGWQSVTYGNGLFVAVASSGTHRVMTWEY